VQVLDGKVKMIAPNILISTPVKLQILFRLSPATVVLSSSDSVFSGSTYIVLHNQKKDGNRVVGSKT
jgi:hypothetical protein